VGGENIGKVRDRQFRGRKRGAVDVLRLRGENHAVNQSTATLQNDPHPNAPALG
jgi:hypothetical protein